MFIFFSKIYHSQEKIIVQVFYVDATDFFLLEHF